MDDHPDDSSLRSGILEGDEDSLRFLVTYYSPRLVAYVRKRGVRHDDALDAVSESLAKVVRKIRLFNPQKGRFSAWIHTITINTLVDRLRKTQADNRIRSLDEISETGFQGTNSLWEADGESESIHRQLSRRVIRDALNRVRERDRIILTEWSYGLKHREIGVILGITENAAKVACHRALKKLKAEVITILEPMDCENARDFKSLLIREGDHEQR